MVETQPKAARFSANLAPNYLLTGVIHMNSRNTISRAGGGAKRPLVRWLQ